MHAGIVLKFYLLFVRHYMCVTLNYLFIQTLKAKYYMKNIYIFNVARAIFNLKL